MYDGVFAENITKDLVALRIEDGLDPGTFRDILTSMIKRRVGIRNIEETVNAMEFEYTFWAKPDNKTAVRQNLIDVSAGSQRAETDMLFLFPFF